MAMSRQKKLDKMEVIELAKEKPKPEFHFLNARATGKLIFETKDLVIGYDEATFKTAESPHGARREDRGHRCEWYR